MISPLKGWRILVTRGKAQQQEMIELIQSNGGIPVDVPLLTYSLINNEMNKRIIHSLNNFDWIFFTSVNGVQFFFELLREYQHTLPKHLKVGAVGKKTGNSLQKHRITPDFLPTLYHAEAMATEFASLHDKERILLVQGNLSRDVLPSLLEKEKIPFETIVIYETKENETSKEKLDKILREDNIDVLTFTSPSCVHAFLKLGGKEAKEFSQKLTVCIGTTTEEAALEAGFRNILTPNQFTVKDMINTLIQFVEKEQIKNE